MMEKPEDVCFLSGNPCSESYACRERVLRNQLAGVVELAERCTHARMLCSSMPAKWLISAIDVLLRKYETGELMLFENSGVLKGEAKPVLAVDFDGVIHRYSKGWNGGEIYDPPVKGAPEALRRISRKFKIVVFTARATTPTRKARVAAYLKKHGISFDEITNRKPPAVAYIDDKAIRFSGSWREILQILEENYEVV